MSHFVCHSALAGEASELGCGCTLCQEIEKPLAAAKPGPAPAQEPGDVPGDLSTGFSITMGAPITGVLEVDADHDWYAVQLVAGTRYRITLDGVALDDYAALEDPYIYLRDASGALIAENDDIRNGVLRNSRLNWIATQTGQYFLDVGAWDDKFVGGYQLAIIEFTPPTYTLDEIAEFLTTGFWGDGGRRWNTSSDNIITFNVTGLTGAGQSLARAAFQSWTNVTNLVFEEVGSGGNIMLDDDRSGAFASSSVSNGFITSSSINIGIGWLNSYGTTIDSYSFQTYVHEIGHALGLGHGGAYNAVATYGVDNLYQNDIWSYTVMSYFDQREASFGSYRVVMGPSLADIVAVHNLYGANTGFNSGDNVYGRNATAGSLYDFANYGITPAFTIYDTGGTDTLDASGYGVNQTINLNAEVFSSIGGLNNNISIARGVIIEGAVAGNGADSLLGNAGDNMLAGNAGADTLDGSAGNDSLNSGAGDDSLIGGTGLDIADYRLAISAISVNLAAGKASGSDIGTDTLFEIEGAAGGQADDFFIGDAGNNLLLGNAGDDTLDGGAGDDSLIGDTGLDFADYSRAISSISVNLAAGAASSSDVGADMLSGIEGAAGGQGDDVFIGNTGDNLLSGNAGADTLDGGAANNSLDGGAGDDSLIGDTGLDIADYGRAIAAISVNLAAGKASGSDIGADMLSGIEAAAGGQGDDVFIGDAGDNLLSGNAGGDTLNGGAGSDSLYGGAGDDLLITDGIADYLDAGAGDDVILLGGTRLADILALFATS